MPQKLALMVEVKMKDIFLSFYPLLWYLFFIMPQMLPQVNIDHSGVWLWFWLLKFRRLISVQTVFSTRQCFSELRSSSLNLHHGLGEAPTRGQRTYRSFPVENTSPRVIFNKNQNGNFLVKDNSAEKFHPLQ